MNIKEDFTMHQHKEEVVDWDDDTKEKMAFVKPTASYNPLSNKIRQAIPEEQLCAMFCGGKKCKYCNPIGRFDESAMVINGLYSAWVTDSILAMSRPCTRLINEYNIVKQFKNAGIRSVINVQRPGEHASCGDPLEPEGFAYSPQTFMDNDIFFYNFGWKDYGVTSMRTVLDMVRVMQFALSEGSVAIHCHAGLGRTGVIIGCYLVFNNRMAGEEAVHYVRAKRPGALQTQEQVNCVVDFSEFMKPLRCVFANHGNDVPAFNLNECLRRQGCYLHGYEGRRLKHLPKIVYVICERLLDFALQRPAFYQRSPKRNILATPNVEDRRKSIRVEAPHAFDEENYVSPRPPTENNQHTLKLPESSNDLRRSASDNGLAALAVPASSDDSESLTRAASQMSLQSTLSDTSSFLGHGSSGSMPAARRIDGEITEEDMSPAVRQVVETFLTSNRSDEVKGKVEKWKLCLNSEEGAWKRLVVEETDIQVFTALLLDWLEHLKTPVIRPQDTQLLRKTTSGPIENLKLLERSVAHFLHYMARFIVQLQPISDDLDEALVLRLLSAMTHQEIQINLSLTPQQSTTSLASVSGAPPRMKPQVATTLIRFFYSLVDTLEIEDNSLDNMSMASFTSRS